MIYSDKILDHFNNPRNVGSMNKDNHDVGTGIVGAPACGDVKASLKMQNLKLLVVVVQLLQVH